MKQNAISYAFTLFKFFYYTLYLFVSVSISLACIFILTRDVELERQNWAFCKDPDLELSLKFRSPNYEHLRGSY